MLVVLVLLQLRQQGSKRRLGVPDKTIVNLGAAAELFSAEVDLDDRRVLGKELLVGKVRSDHQQRIAVHHGAIAGRKSQQAGHAHVERVVVLDELFAAHGVHDGSVELAGELDQLRMGSGTARSARMVIFFEPVQKFRQILISSSVDTRLAAARETQPRTCWTASSRAISPG